jgi:hypothetical protein
VGVPRASFVLAVRDGEPHLRESLESVLAQTFADFELVVVDDGSSDGSREIVRSYRDPRIRLLENGRGLGLAPSLNRGIREARGELLARQDADDVSEPERLARQVAHLDAHPEVALLGCAAREVDSRGRHLRDVALPRDAAAIRWAMLFSCPFVHTAVVFRRSALERVGPYDERFSYSMDYDLWLRIAREFPVANLPEPLVRYRVHEGSMTGAGGARTGEGARLRLALFAGLLGTAADDPQAAGRHAALEALVRGLDRPLPVEAVERAAAELPAVHRGFAAHFGMGGAEASRHGAEVRRAVAGAVLRRAGAARQGGSARDALRLLRAAAALHPGVLLGRRSARVLRRMVLPAGRRRAEP